MVGFRKDGNSLRWEKNYEKIKIEPWGPDTLRMRATLNAEILDQPWALLEPAKTSPAIEISENFAEIDNGKIRAHLTSDGRISFHNTATDELILREPPQHLLIQSGRCYKPLGSELHRIEVRFEPVEGEKIYGLGQHRHGLLNQHGCVILLEQRNSEVSIPFAMSDHGYGILWNNPSIGRVEFARNGTKWVAEASRQIDYVIFIGDNPAEILRRYADLTGHPRMLPEFASGFWQCKLRYKTQDELLGIAREYKKRELPLSVIVIDFFHWTAMGNWDFDSAVWPDPSAMVRELEDMGVKVMISIWPGVSRNSRNFKEMTEKGFLLRNERGIPVYFPMKDKCGNCDEYHHFYDTTNPGARKFVWEKVRQSYFSHGIKIYWLDAVEPEMYPYDPENVRMHIGNGLEVGCVYPLGQQQAFFDGMKSEGEEEIITLCRSAWAGSQKYGAAVWSGDIFSTFESLRQQVRAGLNIGLSGIPWWTTDIGGFMGANIEDPSFRELIVRWFQYGTFCPLFRLHGYRKPSGESTGGPNEVWSFGEEAYGIIKEYMFMRERLRPYIMEQMRIAHETGAPVMRPLFFDFPDDRKSWEIEDQYMFGPDILVAPVLFEGAREREVYLPAGTDWIDVWTGEKIAGDSTITAKAPIERIPLYKRSGSDLAL